MNTAIKLLTTFALNTLLAAKYIVLMANKGKISKSYFRKNKNANFKYQDLTSLSDDIQKLNDIDNHSID